MGGGPSNMNSMIRQAQKMQEEIAAKQEELEEREYEISAGGGMVNIVISGKKVVQNITIQPDIVDPEDIETLQDIIVAAVNEAIRKVEEDSSAEMAKITGNVGFPGLF